MKIVHPVSAKSLRFILASTGQRSGLTQPRNQFSSFAPHQNVNFPTRLISISDMKHFVLLMDGFIMFGCRRFGGVFRINPQSAEGEVRLDQADSPLEDPSVSKGQCYQLLLYRKRVSGTLYSLIVAPDGKVKIIYNVFYNETVQSLFTYILSTQFFFYQTLSTDKNFYYSTEVIVHLKKQVYLFQNYNIIIK